MTITVTVPTLALKQRTALAVMNTGVLYYSTKENIQTKVATARYERKIRRSQRHIGPYIP